MQKPFQSQYKTILCYSLLFVAFFFSSCGNSIKQQDTATNDNIQLIRTLHKQYAHARTLQRAGKYDDAIHMFKACLPSAHNWERQVLNGHTSLGDSLLPMVTETMMQLMNTYQSMGKPDECADYLDSLRRHPSDFMRRYCLRDLYSITAYALSRTDRMAQAEQLADSALILPLYNPTPERLFRDYAYAAAICFSNPGKQEKVMEWSRKALEQANLCGNTSGAQYVTSLLGTLYRRTGRLSDAIDLYLESRRVAQEKNDALGEATACNALAELYLYWDIPTYADRYVSQAIALNGTQTGGNPMIATQSLLLKGQIMLEMEHPDSTLYYYNKAENACHPLPYTSGQADVDYLKGAFRAERCTGDSLQEGIEILHRVTAEGTPLLQAKAYYRLAVAHFRQQQKSKAEAMLDSMYLLLHRFESPQYIEVNYEWVLKHYLEKKDLPNVERFTIDLIEECKFNFNSDICTKMYENIVNLQTEAEQQQLKLEQLEIENDRLYYRIWLFIFLAVILLLSVWIIYRRKLSHAKHELLEARLSSLMDKLEETQRNKEKVEQELSEVTLHKEVAEQQLSALFTHEESRKEIVAVTPSVLREEGEENFRQRFERLYPRFLPALREKVPTIGRKEELSCMLIVLGQDTHQVATIMGIAYKSANMARWRLRQKLGLDKNESLDDFIRTLAE